MALNARTVAVGSTPTRLDTVAEMDGLSGSAVSVYNDGAETVFIGPAGVTTGTGYPVAAGQHLAVTLGGQDEAVYAIAATGPVNVRILEVGV